MSPNRLKHREAHRSSTLTTLEREWRIARGESPNPWGVAKSDGFDTQQIISRPRLSKLEKRSLLESEEDTGRK